MGRCDCALWMRRSVMDVIPAIDLSEGKCVRLRRGDMAQKTVYGDNPVEFALRWEGEGAQIVHVVDLDGAMAGSPQNLATVEAIVEAIQIPVELGGGLRTADDAGRVLDLGVRWAIMGTSALENRDSVQAAVERFPDCVIVGIDARHGYVAVAGWVEKSRVSAAELAVEIDRLSPAKIVFTDIATDGMLQGPNVAGTRALAEAVRTPVIASGGVTNIADVRAICELAEVGVTGMIIGRALYEGTIALPEAVAAASG